MYVCVVFASCVCLCARQVQSSAASISEREPILFEPMSGPKHDERVLGSLPLSQCVSVRGPVMWWLCYNPWWGSEQPPARCGVLSEGVGDLAAELLVWEQMVVGCFKHQWVVCYYLVWMERCFTIHLNLIAHFLSFIIKIIRNEDLMSHP